MKLLKRTTLVGTKLTVLAAALALTVFASGQDAKAGSGQAEIFFSTSSTAAIPAPAIIVNPGTIRNVYIWAKNVSGATGGASAFTLSIGYEDDYFTLYPASGDPNGIGDPVWLGSTGRSAACVPEQTTPIPGRIVGLCTTLDDPPPLGPTGTGLLGHFRINAENTLHPSSQLTFIPFSQGTIGTFILDTPLDLEAQHMPLTLTNSSVVFLGCADNSGPAGPGFGDNVIDLANDILGVILRFQWSPQTPGWHPAFDVNSDGVIDLANDILGTILQFQMQCFNPNAK